MAFVVVQPVFMAVPKPMLTDVGIHYRLESCDIHLFSDELDDIHAELDSLEAAHYLYPVNMTTEVLQNDLLKSVICRNF